MNLSYRIGRILFRVLYTIYFRVRFYDHKHVPSSGPVILASNHASFIDPPLVGCGFSRCINFLARESLFRFPPIGALLRSCKAIPVDRTGGGAKGLKMILQRLHQGEGILLFPEGTRTSDGQLQAARSGIGLIVVKSTAPVVPVRIFGTYEALGRRHRFPRPRHVAVRYGKAILFDALRYEAASCSKERRRKIYQQIADEIMAEIARLQPEKSS